VIGSTHSSVTWRAATARSFSAADIAMDNTESMVPLWGSRSVWGDPSLCQAGTVGAGQRVDGRHFAGVDVSADNTENFSTIYGAPFTMG
jgi:hypothetical protein